VNYALISPDSKTLIVVGDSGHAYFYAKRLLPDADKRSRSHFPGFEWEVVARPKLARGDRTNDDHSFSITFSPSGHLCAISAQGGMISVFDMNMFNRLGDSDTEIVRNLIVCSFGSSRSGISGCIRSMAFSPAPWDLLAWAEDHGRAGIADVRQDFCRRQIIKLETHGPDLEKVVLQDSTDRCAKELNIRRSAHRPERDNFHSEHPESSGESLLGESDDWSDGSLSERREPNRTRRATDDQSTPQPRLDPNIHMELMFPDQRQVRQREVLRRTLHRAGSTDEDDSSSRLRTSPDYALGRVLARHRQLHRSSTYLSQEPAPRSDQASRAHLNASYRSRITASPARMTEDDMETDGSTLFTSPTRELAPRSRGREAHHMSHEHLLADPWYAISSTYGPSTRPRADSSYRGEARGVEGSAEERAGSSYRSSAPAPTQASSRFLDVNPTYAQVVAPVPPRNPGMQRVPAVPEVEEHGQLRNWNGTTDVSDPRSTRARTLARADYERYRRIIEDQMRSHLQAPSDPTEAAERRAELGELRLARQMIMHNARNMVDGNGNWVANEALERLLDRPSQGSADGLGGNATAREIGVGTAGIGWSIDGGQL
jgi:hypothetical protein